MHAGDSDSDDDEMEEEEEEDEDQFEDAEDEDHFPVSAGNAEKEDAARSLLSLQNPTNNSPSMTHQGLMPNRPKPSTYHVDPQRLSDNPNADPNEQQAGNEGPLRSEQALVSANTKRAQDLQADAPEPCLNLKQFLPPNTAERYYFSSPANSANLQDQSSTVTTLASRGEAVNVVSSVTISTSSPMIWSIARMSKMTSPSSATLTTATSLTRERPSMLPLGIGGSVSIYKTSNSISSTPSLISLVSSNSLMPNSIKERSADILSPVTESASVLSFINKTSTMMGSNGGSRMFESENDTPALSTYLQERAAVRAANKTTPFVVTGTVGSASPKLIGHENITPNIAATHVTLSTISSSTTITSTSEMVKSNFNSSSHNTEDKYAPRNVTMNVKDLPENANSNSASNVTSRHPQLPQDIHLATANAIAKCSVASSTSNADASAAISGDNKLPTAAQNDSKDPQGCSTSEQTEIFQTNADGKSECGICHKIFSKATQLRLHVNIHYFERPFRCDSCAVSFRTKGHLQKHKRSVGHFNKVNINATFGTPTASNPRPFKCIDCVIAFRIHGHLAKHLRSKMHIMKLECSGKLPIGMFAEMERLGTNLNEIDTSDCENSLESLQQIALRLYKQDPSKLIGRDDEMSRNIPEHLVGSDASDTEDSEPTTNGEPVKVEAPQSQEISNHSTSNGSQPLPPPPALPTPLQNSSSGENFSRRASFSSSGHDDHSTDSEAVSRN
jgi:hypothetical protein